MEDMWMEWLQTPWASMWVWSYVQKCMRKITCEVFLSTPPVGYSGSLSTVNEKPTVTKRILISKKNYELISSSIQTCLTTMCLKRDAIVCIDLDIPLSFVSSLFIWSEFICMIFFRKFIPLFALLFWLSDCELWFTINWISEKSIVNTCKMFILEVDVLTTSLPRIPVLFVFRSCRVKHHE